MSKHTIMHKLALSRAMLLILTCFMNTRVFGQVDTLRIPVGRSLQVSRTHFVPFTPTQLVFVEQFTFPSFVSAEHDTAIFVGPNTVMVTFTLSLKVDATIGQLYSKSLSDLYLRGQLAHKVDERSVIVAEDTITDGVASDRTIQPALALAQNYPNPFNPTTTISYSLATRTPVSLKIYDLSGREVATLVDDIEPAGKHRVTFQADHLPSGVYIYRLQAGRAVETEQMLLMK